MARILEKEIWKRFQKTKSHKLREKLIIQYIPFAKLTANKLYPKFYVHYSIDELYSFSYLGLINAIDKFDPKYGCVFETYAYKRIYGEIIDLIRKETAGYFRRDTKEKIISEISIEQNNINLDNIKKTTKDVVWDCFLKSFVEDFVRKELEKLPPKQKFVIIEHCIKERKITDIGKDLGITKSAVSLIKKEAFKNLKVIFKNQWNLGLFSVD